MNNAPTTTTRGERNNNPLNIRYNPRNQWRNQLTPDNKGFCRFATMQDGINAAARLLYVYYTRYNLNTIELIVSRWAPASENNVEAYIKTCTRLTAFKRNEVLPFTYLGIGILLQAMARVESQVRIQSGSVQLAIEKAIR